MTYVLKIHELPEGYVTVTDLGQLYKLRRGKRKAIPENMIRYNQQIIYIYTELEDGYYQRVLTPEMSDKDLQKYIDRRALYFKPIN